MATEADWYWALRVALDDFRETLDATTIPAEGGGVIVGDAPHAIALSEATQALHHELAATHAMLTRRHGQPIADLPPGVALLESDSPDGPRTPVSGDGVEATCMGIGGDGADARLLAALVDATTATAFPIDRWNAMQAGRPGANHQRFQPGDVIPAEHVARVERAAKLLLGSREKGAMRARGGGHPPRDGDAGAGGPIHVPANQGIASGDAGRMDKHAQGLPSGANTEKGGEKTRRKLVAPAKVTRRGESLTEAPEDHPAVLAWKDFAHDGAVKDFGRETLPTLEEIAGLCRAIGLSVPGSNEAKERVQRLSLWAHAIMEDTDAPGPYWLDGDGLLSIRPRPDRPLGDLIGPPVESIVADTRDYQFAESRRDRTIMAQLCEKIAADGCALQEALARAASVVAPAVAEPAPSDVAPELVERIAERVAQRTAVAIDECDVALLAFLNRTPMLRRKVSDVLPDDGPQDRKAIGNRLRRLADRTPPLVDYPKGGGVAILPAGIEALRQATAPTPR